MSSYFARLWQSFKFVSKRRLVGKDLQGNSFYETIMDPDVDGTPRIRRTVQYVGTNEAWRAAGKLHSLPVQWSAWLSYSRQQPPTIEELVNDQLRQQKLAENVSKLKQQDEEERRREAVERDQLLRISRAQTKPQGEDIQTTQARPEPEAIPEAPPSRPIGPTAEPQTWTPSATRRGPAPSSH